MNRKLALVLAVILAVLLPMTIVAQKKARTTKKASESVTGCLNKGPDASHFTLKDDKGKEHTVIGDSAALSKHANNHNVTITGMMTKEGGKQVLKMGSANDLKMNSMCK